MEASEQIIKELVKALETFKQKSLETHKLLLIESQATNKIYIQILSALRHQNAILDDLKENNRLLLS